MSNYICINLKSPGIQKFSEKNDEHILSLRLEYGMEAHIEPDDKVVFLDHEGFSINDKSDYYFSSSGNVQSIEKLKEINDENKFNVYRVDLLIDSELKENNLLEELLYSLKKIYNYKNPIRHFLRPYTYLEEIDFTTIINGRIFISRTAFGKLINSLPPLHVQNFILTLINSQGLQFFNNRDYIGALKDLKTYIVEEIENRGDFLISIETILRENFSQLLDINEIGFCDSENQKPDIITKQATLFKTLFGIAKEFNIWEMIEEGISENTNEKFFNESFANIDWPINYRKL